MRPAARSRGPDPGSMSQPMSQSPQPAQARAQARAQAQVDAPGVAHPGRIQPLAYASVMLIVFVTTVIELAVKAGTGTAMLTTLVAIVVAGTVCVLWGTTMALRRPDGHDSQDSADGHDSQDGQGSQNGHEVVPAR